MAVIFAATLLPLVIITALAIDFSFYVLTRSQLDLAAHAAAIHAVRIAAQLANSGSATPSAAAAAGNVAGKQWFTAQAGSLGSAALPANGVSVNVVYNGTPQGFASTVNYSATVATHLGAFIIPSWPLTGTATADLPSSAPYVDIIVLFDNSSSMELPSTAAGIKLLASKTNNASYGGSCSYACHWTTSKDSTGNYKDNYGVARYNNIQLRLDVIIGSLLNMIATIQSYNSGGTYRLAIYTFDTGLQSIFPLSSNLASAAAAVTGLSIPLSNWTSNTNFSAAMRSLSSQVSPSGNGTTATTPRQFLFILTDGVEDATGGSQNRTVTTIDSSNCAALKNNGTTISVVETQYLYSNDQYYNQWIAPIRAQITPALKACASSNTNYYLATDGSAIQTALSQLLQTTISTPARMTR